LGSADLLYPLEGSSESVIELLQESAETYPNSECHAVFGGGFGFAGTAVVSGF